MLCPSDLQLSAYYDGETSNRLRKKIEKHLSLCPRCQAKVKEFQQLSTLFEPQKALFSSPREKLLYQKILSSIDFSSKRADSFPLKKILSKKFSFTGQLFPLPLLPLAVSSVLLFFFIGLFLFSPKASLKKPLLTQGNSLYQQEEKVFQDKSQDPFQNALNRSDSSLAKGEDRQKSVSRLSPSNSVTSKGSVAVAEKAAEMDFHPALKESESSISVEKESVPTGTSPSYAQLLKENPLAQSVDQLRHVEAGSEESLSSFSSLTATSLPIAVRKNENPLFLSSKTPFPVTATVQKRENRLFASESSSFNSMEERLFYSLLQEKTNDEKNLFLFEIPSIFSFSMQGEPDFEVLDE